MAEKSDLYVGQTIYFKNQKGTKTLIVEKINPKKVKARYPNNPNRFMRIPYHMIRLDPNEEKEFMFEKSTVKTNGDLRRLMEETKKEMGCVIETLFNPSEKAKLKTVSINFNKQITYRKFGHYDHIDNNIEITRSFIEIPEWVIKSTIWHEILHIHFNKYINGKQSHGTVFRSYEAKYSRNTDATKFKSELAYEIRINGMKRINKIPSAKRNPSPKPKPKIISQPMITMKPTKPKVIAEFTETITESDDDKMIRELKNAGLFPEFMEGQDLSEWDLRFLRNKHKRMK